MPFNKERSREITRATCLRHFAGRDSIKSAVFLASTLSAEAAGFLRIPIGSFLTPAVGTDATKVKIYEGLGTNANDKQTVTITGTPTGGTFTLSYNGLTTAAIKYNATSAEVVAALAALTNIGPGNIEGSGGALPGTPVVVSFKELLGNEPQNVITANGAGLTGGTSPAVAVTHTTPGTTAEHIVGVFDGPDKDFLGKTEADNSPIPIYYHSCVFDITKLQNWNLYGATAKAALPTCEFY